MLVLLGGERGNGPLLLLLPHSGSHSGAFMPVARALPGGAWVMGVDYPGHGTGFNEPLPSGVDTLAAQIAAAVAAEAPAEVVIFGHSFGAIVGFEVTRALARHRVPVRHLVASSCLDPHAMASEPRTVHLVSDATLLDLLVSNGGVAEELLAEPELLDVVLPIIRHDTRLGELHRPSPGAVVDAPITAVSGVDDQTLAGSDLAGWADCTTVEFAVEYLPGSHFHVIEQPQGTAALLARLLARVVERPAQPTEGQLA